MYRFVSTQKDHILTQITKSTGNININSTIAGLLYVNNGLLVQEGAYVG